MCQTMKENRPRGHPHNRGACCCNTGLAATDEIRLLEEQKSDLAAIICRIDTKIEYLKREKP